MKSELKNKFKEYFPLKIKDAMISFMVLLGALFICILLRSFDNSVTYVSMIFILAVFLVSRYTTGYFFGIVSVILSVLSVNYIFTYPYYEFNFTLSGYPLTIICMLVVCLITCTLTTQIKQHTKIKIEVEKEKTRSNLLRAVSHDLRTPLTTILGASSAIIENDSVLSSNQRISLLNEIKADAQWLIRMVENLLSITRIDTECSAKVVKQLEAAEEVVAEAVNKFQKRFQSMGVEVKVPDELLLIPMDAMLIEQVIINVLENVVIHSKTATTIQITVSKSNNDALFEISDDGEGISIQVLPHIFNGYFSHSCEVSGDSKKNMGIGLSVCNTIIKAHDGTMCAKNKNNGNSGAIFSFTLPLEEIIDEQ